MVRVSDLARYHGTTNAVVIDIARGFGKAMRRRGRRYPALDAAEVMAIIAELYRRRGATTRRRGRRRIGDRAEAMRRFWTNRNT